MTESPEQLMLDGNSLTLADLASAAHGQRSVALSPAGLERMAAARCLVDQAVENKIPVYGVTTGLGARAKEALDAETLAEFSYRTLRGRAHAVGPPTAREVVRAAMIVRANTLLLGAAGASPGVAEHYVNCINANITPVVGEVASVGAGDLVWNATLGLALIGEGRMMLPDGSISESREAMRSVDIAPLTLGPRDGLAVANSAAYSAAASALAVHKVKHAFAVAQAAAALSMEGFRANLSPLNERALALRPQPGQLEAARGLLTWLEGSELHSADAARRLQDPLSIRNLPQIHGAALAALEFAEIAATMEINGASDNPVTLIEEGRIISGGAYHTPHLTNALEAAARGYVHLAMAQLARLSKMLSARFTDLPLFLAEKDGASNGFAPLMKTAEAIVGRIVHAAQPVLVWPSLNADGVEDSLTHTPIAANALKDVADNAVYLTAIELIIAARAVELRGCEGRVTAPLAGVLNRVRAITSPGHHDRPLGHDVEALAHDIAMRAFDQGNI